MTIHNCTLFGTPRAGIAGLSPPQVLIFFHIPKTGGRTMNAILQHCLADKYFDFSFGEEPPDTSLWVYSTARIAKKFHQLSAMRQGKVRCMGGDHLTYDVHTLFDQPSKFFTTLRHPVDRVISNFFYLQILTSLPCSRRFIKDLTLEQYLDSGICLDNQQVRMVSGCPELDEPWDPAGRPIPTPPVEQLHLEIAKRNIEERFIVAAPLEKFTALVWFLKRLYGWPLHRVLFRIYNNNSNRPRLENVSKATRKRLETLNQHDIELYEWVKARFAKQIEPFEPNFSREVRRFEMLNHFANRIGRHSPQSIRVMAHHVLFPAQYRSRC